MSPCDDLMTLVNKAGVEGADAECKQELIFFSPCLRLLFLGGIRVDKVATGYRQASMHSARCTYVSTWRFTIKRFTKPAGDGGCLLGTTSVPLGGDARQHCLFLECWVPKKMCTTRR